jgi:hypothetical protein
VDPGSTEKLVTETALDSFILYFFSTKRTFLHNFPSLEQMAFVVG